MNYELTRVRTYKDFTTKEEVLNFTNKKKAIDTAKILIEQCKAGDVLKSNIDMISYIVRVDSVYDANTAIKCGFRGDNYFLFNSED